MSCVNCSPSKHAFPKSTILQRISSSFPHLLVTRLLFPKKSGTERSNAASLHSWSSEGQFASRSSSGFSTNPSFTTSQQDRKHTFRDEKRHEDAVQRLEESRLWRQELLPRVHDEHVFVGGESELGVRQVEDEKAWNSRLQNLWYHTRSSFLPKSARTKRASKRRLHSMCCRLSSIVSPMST